MWKLNSWHTTVFIYNCRFGLDTQYPIILDNVDCSTSSYLTILQCSYSTIISSSCVHGSNDVSVTCCELLTDNYLNYKKIKVTYKQTTVHPCSISLVLRVHGSGRSRSDYTGNCKPLLALHWLHYITFINHYHQTIILHIFDMANQLHELMLLLPRGIAHAQSMQSLGLYTHALTFIWTLDVRSATAWCSVKSSEQLN